MPNQSNMKTRYNSVYNRQTWTPYLTFGIITTILTSYVDSLVWIQEPNSPFYALLGAPTTLIWKYNLENDTVERAKWGKFESGSMLSTYAHQQHNDNTIVINPNIHGFQMPASLIIKNITNAMEGDIIGCTVDAESGPTFSSTTTLKTIEYQLIDHSSLTVDLVEGNGFMFWLTFMTSEVPRNHSFTNATHVGDFTRTLTPNGTQGGMLVYNYTMTINAVGRQHDGKYQPIITHDNLDIKLLEDKFLTVIVRYAPDQTILTASPTISNQYALEGNEINITCTANGFPRPTYQLFKGTAVLSSGTTDVHTIASMSQSSEGNYSCIATNTLGADAKETIMVTSGNVPVALSPNVNTTISSTSSHTVTCESFARPAASITWYRGSTVVSSPEYQITTSTSASNDGFQTDSSLTIVNPGLDENLKLFTCRQENVFGFNESTSFFSVTYPPTFVANGKPTNQSVVSGGNVTFVCHASVNPGVVTYLWKFNDVPLQTHQGLSNGNLTLTNLNNTLHGGKYTCLATSASETATAEAYLTVNVIPGIVRSSNKDTTVISGAVVSLVCHASGNPPPIITWTRDSNFLATGETYSIDTRGIPIGSYGYSCTAKNIAGEVSKAFQVNIVVASSGAVSDDNIEEWLIPLLVCICMLLLLLLILLILRRKTREKPDSDSDSEDDGRDIYVANATYKKQQEDTVKDQPDAEMGNDNPMFVNGMGLDDEGEDTMTVNPMYMNEAHGSPTRDGPPKMADGISTVATRYMVYLPSDDDIQAGRGMMEAEMEFGHEDSDYLNEKLKALEDYEVEGYESFMSPHSTLNSHYKRHPRVPDTPTAANNGKDVDEYVDTLFDFRAQAN